MTALAAVGTAVLLALVGVFVLDFIFRQEIQSLQRLGLIVVAALAVAWAWRKYAQPLLSVRESDIDMALMVERQQQIDSDLVAAIQFEDDVQGRWGSRQLETAVIEYVAQVGRDINVFQGFNREQLKSRVTMLRNYRRGGRNRRADFPGPCPRFSNRLCLGSMHYPSATQIKSLAINGRDVLHGGMQPQNIRCAEGREVELHSPLRGEPAQRRQTVGCRRANDSNGPKLNITPLSPEDRLARLRTAQNMVAEARQSPDLDLAGPWYEELASLVQFESPEGGSAGVWMRSASAERIGQATAQRKLGEHRRIAHRTLTAQPLVEAPRALRGPSAAAQRAGHATAFHWAMLTPIRPRSA